MHFFKCVRSFTVTFAIMQENMALLSEQNRKKGGVQRLRIHINGETYCPMS